MLDESHRGGFGKCAWSYRLVLWLRKRYNIPDDENRKGHGIELINLSQPATRSDFALAHFGRVVKARPDVLFVDYAVNDPLGGAGSSSETYIRMARAATELFIRKFLAMDTSRPKAIVYVVMQRSFEPSTFSWADEVYAPVCSA